MDFQSLRRLLLWSLFTVPKTACEAPDLVEEDGYGYVKAQVDPDLSELCTSHPDAEQIRLEALRTTCVDEPCHLVVAGADHTCGPGASGVLDVRLEHEGRYQFELVAVSAGAPETRECYAPAAKDHLDVPAQTFTPFLVQLEFLSSGPCA